MKQGHRTVRAWIYSAGAEIDLGPKTQQDKSTVDIPTDIKRNNASTWVKQVAGALNGY